MEGYRYRYPTGHAFCESCASETDSATYFSITEIAKGCVITGCSNTNAGGEYIVPKDVNLRP